MPRRLKIAYTERAFEILGTVNGRDSIKAAQTDFTDTSALIITDLDSEFAENEKIRAFGVPVFLILTGESNVEKLIECASGIIDLQHGEHGFYERQIVNAAEKYEEEQAKITPEEKAKAEQENEERKRKFAEQKAEIEKEKKERVPKLKEFQEET